MSLRRLSLLAVAVVLTACNGKLPAQPPGEPVKTASTKPRASTDPLVVKPPTTLALLKAPAGPSTKLAGMVAIDAHYALRAGGAKLIGADGGTLVGADGASLLGADGATLVGADGASLVGMDAASVYVGGALIGADGASLVGADAASLVAAGAGNLIGKRKLELMQAAGAAKFTLGTVLRAAAMEIQVRSMADGQLLSLGTDAAGQPVYSVLTNARGEYTIYLPKDISGNNVIVTAVVPETKDARLTYGAVADPEAAGGVAVDEDTSMASAYFREAFISRLEREILLEVEGKNEDDVDVSEFENMGFATDAIATLRATVRDAQLGQGQPFAGERRARTTAAGDALLGFVKLEGLTDLETGKPALAAFADLMREVREGARARLQEDPAYFEKQAFLQQANALAPGFGMPPVAIRKPSDVPDFVLRYILIRNVLGGSTSARMREVLMPTLEIDEPSARAKVEKLNILMNMFLLNTITVLAAEDKVALNAAVKALSQPAR